MAAAALVGNPGQEVIQSFVVRPDIVALVRKITDIAQRLYLTRDQAKIGPMFLNMERPTIVVGGILGARVIVVMNGVGEPIVGRGGEKTVYLGLTTFDKIYAVSKTVFFPRVRVNQERHFEESINIEKEVTGLPGVVPLVSSVIELNPFQVPIAGLAVRPFYEKGDLLDFLESGKGVNLTHEQVISLFLDISRGLQSVHSRGVLYLDLKLENVVLGIVDGFLRAAITDFGHARKGAQPKSIGGTQMILPPERVLNSIITSKSDMWALGLLFYLTLVGGKFPWEPEDVSKTKRVMEGMMTDDAFLDPLYARLDLVTRVHPDLVQLTKGLLSYLPENRPDTNIVVERISKILSDLTVKLS